MATPDQTAAAASQMLRIVADAESPLRWSPSPERLSHLRARDALASPGSPNRRRTSFSASPNICVSPTVDLQHHSNLEPETELETELEPEPEPEPVPAVRSSLALALAPALSPTLTPAAREMQRVALRARRLARIQAQCAKAAGTSSSKYYTDAAVLHRLELTEQPAVVAALDSIWEAANTDARDRIIDRSEYLMMHRKITLALDPTIKPRDFKQAVNEEWKEDSEGKKGLDRERFDWCWFELADMWTDTMEAEEYARFLNSVLRLMTTTRSVRRDDGQLIQQVVWRDDREVMRAHYEHRRQQGHAFSQDDNFPLALATWAAYLGQRSMHPSRAGTPHGAIVPGQVAFGSTAFPYGSAAPFGSSSYGGNGSASAEPGNLRLRQPTTSASAPQLTPLSSTAPPRQRLRLLPPTAPTAAVPVAAAPAAAAPAAAAPVTAATTANAATAAGAVAVAAARAAAARAAAAAVAPTAAAPTAAAPVAATRADAAAAYYLGSTAAAAPAPAPPAPVLAPAPSAHDLAQSALRPPAPWHDLAPSALGPAPHVAPAELLLATSSSARELLLADLHSISPALPRPDKMLPNGVPRRAAATMRSAKRRGPVSLVSLATVGGGGGGGGGGTSFGNSASQSGRWLADEAFARAARGEAAAAAAAAAADVEESRAARRGRATSQADLSVSAATSYPSPAARSTEYGVRPPPPSLGEYGVRPPPPKSLYSRTPSLGAIPLAPSTLSATVAPDAATLPLPAYRPDTSPCRKWAAGVLGAQAAASAGDAAAAATEQAEATAVAIAACDARAMQGSAGCEARLQALRRLLAFGPQAYWSLPLLLGQAEASDDRSLLACADLLHAHASSGAAVDPRLGAAEGVQQLRRGAVQLLGVVHAHPVTAALLALRRIDGAALRSAAPRCDAAERARVLRLAQSSTWFDGKVARLAAKELVVHDGRQAAKHGAAACPAYHTWAQLRR